MRRPRTRAVDPPDRPHAPGIGHVQREVAQRRDLRAHRIEGLPIVAYGGATDEAFVVQRDALAAGGHRESIGLIAKLRAIERDILRIRDERAGRDASDAVIIMIDRGKRALRLDQRADVAACCLHPRPQADRQRVGVARLPILIDMLVAHARVDERLQLDFLRNGGCCGGQRGDRHNEVLHDETPRMAAASAGSPGCPTARLCAVSGEPRCPGAAASMPDLPRYASLEEYVGSRVLPRRTPPGRRRFPSIVGCSG